MTTYQTIISELEIANKLANNGCGSATIRSIIQALQHDDYESACREWECDGDKLTQYPILRALIIKHFGCRAHLIKDCQNWLCRKVNNREI